MRTLVLFNLWTDLLLELIHDTHHIAFTAVFRAEGIVMWKADGDRPLDKVFILGQEFKLNMNLGRFIRHILGEMNEFFCFCFYGFLLIIRDGEVLGVDSDHKHGGKSLPILAKAFDFSKDFLA